MFVASNTVTVSRKQDLKIFHFVFLAVSEVIGFLGDISLSLHELFPSHYQTMLSLICSSILMFQAFLR